MADDRVTDDDLGAAPGMPGQVLRWTQGQFDAYGPSDDADGLEGVAGVRRTAWSPRTCRLAQTDQHQRDMLRMLTHVDPAIAADVAAAAAGRRVPVLSGFVGRSGT